MAYLKQVLFIASLHFYKDCSAKNEVPFSYSLENCNTNSITVHDDCPRATTPGFCYHILPISDSVYPSDGFCLLRDGSQGFEPGIVSYEMTTKVHTGYLTAGTGIYYNYQDEENYDVVYKLDFTSTTCIVGYVENGIIFESSNVNCPPVGEESWIKFSVRVESEVAEVTMRHLSEEVTFTVQPYFPFNAICGSLAANGFENEHHHCQNINLQTETCQHNPHSPMCDPCTLAYNVESVPYFPLPNSRNFLLWYSRSLEMIYTSCFIKVLVDRDDGVAVNVKSMVGSFEYESGGRGQDNIQPGTIYGERNQCTKKKVACIEVKSAGILTNGKRIDRDVTHVVVTVQDKTLTGYEVNSELSRLYGKTIIGGSENEFSLYVHDRPYGKDFGIYCYKTLDGPNAAKYAYNICAADEYSGKDVPEDEINPSGWAVRFY